MQNYFNYFTEIETRFQARRGTLLLLSTLDWALIETWREAGVPLEAVLRGIDNAFDKYEARRAKAGSRARKVNGLAWCAQSVMLAAEEMQEALVGVSKAKEAEGSGFEGERIAGYLRENATLLRAASGDNSTAAVLESVAVRLTAMADDVAATRDPDTESLELTLTALEARLLAALTLAAPEEQLLHLKEQAARELAAVRGNMSAVQLRQVTEQFVHKRLLEAAGLPRLSIFYMGLR